MKRNLAQLYYLQSFRFECPKCNSSIPYFDVRIGLKDRWAAKWLIPPKIRYYLPDDLSLFGRR
jgi:hypothetical protein